MKSFEEVISMAQSQSTKKIAVAVAQDRHVLEAIKDAKKIGLAEAILVGDKDKIAEVANEIGMDISGFEVIHEPDVAKAALKAVELVSTGKADMVMKGIVDTATFLRAVLNKEIGLRTGKIMSHIAVYDVPGIDRLLFITDAAFNMYPELKEKVDIAVSYTHLTLPTKRIV